MQSSPDPKEPVEMEDEDNEDEPQEIHLHELRMLGGFLRPYARPYRRPLIVLLIALIIETLFNFSFPLAAQFLIDDGLIQRNSDVLVGVLIFLAVAAVMVESMGLLCDYISAKIFAGMVKDIRVRLFTHLQTLSMGFFGHARTGAILSRFSGDLVGLEAMLVSVISWLILPLLEVIYATVLMFWFSVWLGLIGALIFPLVLWGPRIFAMRAFARSYEKRQSEADLLAGVQENVAAQPVVKGYGMEARAREDFEKRNRSWLRIAFRFNFLSFLVERTSNAGVYFLHLVIFGLGAYWVFHDKLSLGTFVAFEGMFLSMGYALTYVTQFVPSLAQAAGSVRHMNELFAKQPHLEDAPDAVPASRMERDIAFDHVEFHYPDGPFRLEDFNLRVPVGCHTAIVGASGSGKSTVLNLLLRFHDPTAGAILLDGRDLRTLTQASLRSQIGFVFQENFLFHASILDNIRVGLPDATREQVEAAARAAEIHDFISRLPDGYDTIVGERGSRLSGGQRQRIAIARALVRNPAILILDEATSALDYATESALLPTLRKAASGRCVISVTHRLNTVIDADSVVVLDHGRIIEQGNPQELRQRDSRFAELLRNQDGMG